MLLKMMRTSSWVIGGFGGVVDESDAVDDVRAEEEDASGGDAGKFCNGTV